MDNKTLEALDKSIARHEGNLKAEAPYVVNLSAGNCPLCEVFFFSSFGSRCVGCPIKNHTGKSNCNSTPYYALEGAWDAWIVSDTDADAKSFRLAEQAMVDFLKSLRPTPEKS